MEKQADAAAGVTTPNKDILVSGASFAGLATAYCLNRLGYKVTVVEIAKSLKKGGTPVNIGAEAKDTLKRMGLLEQVQANRLRMEGIEFKNADDVTEGAMRQPADAARADDDWEIERDTLLDIVFGSVKDDAEFVFNNSITALDETANDINVSFKDGSMRSFALVVGCDGNHLLVRK
jgi:2-polyprenyl-6-methoxyphenol hydroxylase-like FAD-dependent oxidoreductase